MENQGHNLGLGLEITHFDKDGNIKNIIKGEDKLLGDFRLNVKIRDSKGEIINEAEYPVKSFVKNFMLQLQMLFSNISTSLQNTAGGFTTASTTAVYRIDSSSSDDTYGILVGSGTTGVTITDYSLNAKFMQGSALNQLGYNTQIINTVLTDSPGYKFDAVRTFTNTYISSQTINEVCVAGNGLGNLVMSLRDIISPGLSVGTNQTAVVTYTYKISGATSSGYTKQFLDMLYGMTKYSASLPMKATTSDGTSTTSFDITSSTRWKTGAPIANNGYGIVVGLSNIAYTVNDYKLVNMIENGIGADQLNYLDVNYEVVSIPATTNTAIFSIKRIMVNNSAAPITVNETGIYCNGDNTNRICIVRNVPSPVVMAVGDAIQVKYNLSITV